MRLLHLDLSLTRRRGDNGPKLFLMMPTIELALLPLGVAGKSREGSQGGREIGRFSGVQTSRLPISRPPCKILWRNHDGKLVTIVAGDNPFRQPYPGLG